MLSVGSCFSGIGGIELGLERTGGFETKWQIENDPYASAVLKKHWPNVKQYGDITTVEPTDLERVDVICGGFPCQDVSYAGKREGLKGKRTTLWYELSTLLCLLRPRWFVGENVPGLLSSDDGRFFGRILRDLATFGYDVEWQVLSASGVGAPHLRRRVFILAHSMRSGGGSKLGEQQNKWAEVSNSSSKGDVANPLSSRKRRIKREVQVKKDALSDTTINGRGEVGAWESIPPGEKEMADPKSLHAQRFDNRQRKGDPGGSNWWAIEPDVGRVAYGVPSRVDRLRCLGNAVVPQVSQKIGEMILDYESSNSH